MFRKFNYKKGFSKIKFFDIHFVVYSSAGRSGFSKKVAPKTPSHLRESFEIYFKGLELRRWHYGERGTRF